MIPLMYDLKNNKCLIVGGGNAALIKYKNISKFTQNVYVIAPSICDELKQLLSLDKCIEKPFSIKYLENVKIVITASDDKALNEEIEKITDKLNIICIRSDSKGQGTFQLPSSKAQEGITLSVSTNGTYPALASKIVNEIDLTRYANKLLALSKFRKAILKSNLNKIIARKKLKYVLNDEILFSDEFENILYDILKEHSNE